MSFESHFDGNVALVIGGASGISYAVARALGLAGARVWIADVDDDAGEKAASSLRAEGSRANFRSANVISESSVERLVSEIVKSDEKIDILFHGAGISNRLPVLKLPLEKWRNLIDVNLTGVFISNKAVGRFMVQKGYGRIINVASLPGVTEMGFTGNADYIAAKAGLVAFTRSLAGEFRDLNVDVTANLIGPGPTNTPMYRTGKPLDEIEHDKSIGTLSEPEDLVPTCLFLASRNSYYVSGQLIGFKNALASIPHARERVSLP
jgi:NAD(P)-dependent dehydrogenase (short-subunit alcohol dehydrogenase family)